MAEKRAVMDGCDGGSWSALCAILRKPKQIARLNKTMIVAIPAVYHTSAVDDHKLEPAQVNAAPELLILIKRVHRRLQPPRPSPSQTFPSTARTSGTAHTQLHI